MSKMFQVYGIGQALIPVLPPPLGFENAPTSNQTNYEIGQIVFTPPTSPTSFFMYGGGGNWVEFATSSGDVTSVTGTANQISASPTSGAVVLSLIGPYTPATYTAHGVLIGAGTGSIVATATGSAGQVLQSGGASANPSYSTATYPATATGTGTILRADGTNWAATTATYPNTVAVSELLYGSSTNVVGSLSGAAFGTLVSGSSGAPSWINLGTGQVVIGQQSAQPVATSMTNALITYVPAFNAIPVATADTGGVAVVTIGHINLWSLPQYGAYFEEYNTVATQVIVPPLSATAGRGLNLDVMTGANSAGCEITEGNSVNSKNAFVTGTAAAFFVSATFNIATLADVAALYVGFRKVQTYQATLPGGYTDFAAIGVVGAAGEIELQTQTASGGVTTTDTTQAITAATNFTLKVLVSAGGVVTYQLNGSAPTVVAAYTFTASTTVVPYIIYTADAGGHDEVDLVAYSCGVQ
jgi:hypothetical protein